MGVLALYDRFRERLGLFNSVAVAVMLTLTYFCHLVPWVFAGGALAVLSLAGPAEGRWCRLSWTAAIVLSAVPCWLVYRSLSTAHGGGLEFDWKHLRGFDPIGVKIPVDVVCAGRLPGHHESFASIYRDGFGDRGAGRRSPGDAPRLVRVDAGFSAPLY